MTLGPKIDDYYLLHTHVRDTFAMVGSTTLRIIFECVTCSCDVFLCQALGTTKWCSLLILTTGVALIQMPRGEVKAGCKTVPF